MIDSRKPTLVSRILASISRRFGNPHYTYKFKLPLPCCEWCHSHEEVEKRNHNELDKRLESLENRVKGLWEGAKADEAELFKMRLQVAMQIFDQTMRAQSKQMGIVSSPVEIASQFCSAFDSAEALIRGSARGDHGANARPVHFDGKFTAPTNTHFPSRNGR